MQLHFLFIVRFKFCFVINVIVNVVSLMIHSLSMWLFGRLSVKTLREKLEFCKIAKIIKKKPLRLYLSGQKTCPLKSSNLSFDKV